MKKKIVSFLIRSYKLIKVLSIILNVIAFLALIIWLFDKDLYIFEKKLDKEALFVVLTTIAVSLNQFHKWLLSEAEYSPAYALALGYMNNFIEPIIVQLIEDGVKTPIVYIYRPNSITELYKLNIDKTKATIRNMSFELTELQLNLRHGRARDILTIQKSKTKKVFFDFPNTLLSLTSYIEFKCNSRKNELNNKEKEKITDSLLEKFYSKIDDLAESKNLKQNIKYCDQNLDITF